MDRICPLQYKNVELIAQYYFPCSITSSDHCTVPLLLLHTLHTLLNIHFDVVLHCVYV